MQQVTSRPYGDEHAEALTALDFATVRLPVDSYARPAKLFTAHRELIVSHLGLLTDSSRRRVIAAIVSRCQAGLYFFDSWVHPGKGSVPRCRWRATTSLPQLNAGGGR